MACYGISFSFQTFNVKLVFIQFFGTKSEPNNISVRFGCLYIFPIAFYPSLPYRVEIIILNQFLNIFVIPVIYFSHINYREFLNYSVRCGACYANPINRNTCGLCKPMWHNLLPHRAVHEPLYRKALSSVQPRMSPPAGRY
jgi:hypothetical protein